MKPGDVVTLNSGGPDMTVVSIETDGYVNVVWFQEGGVTSNLSGLIYLNERTGRFPSVCLMVENDNNVALNEEK